MSRHLICRVKPSSVWLIIAFFAVCTLGIYTAPLWSDRSFYPWDQLDPGWLIGAIACSIMTFVLIPRFLVRLVSSNGWGLWTERGSLFLVSRAEPIPLEEIGLVRIGEKGFARVIIEMKDGKSVTVAAWAMDMSEHDMVTRIEAARIDHRQRQARPLS